jgi:6-phosphogluconolactonase (cycloisomerase 2 family)
MIGKPSSPALLGIAVLCALVVSACSNGTHLHFVAITPASGTVFFSSGTAAGVKGASAARNARRKAAISPQGLSTAACGQLKFTATAFFSDGSSVDESNAVTWSSSNSSVASVSPNGTAFGFGLGTSTIGATFNTVAASPATLEVDELNTITMNPMTANIASGGSQTFQALGNFTLAGGSNGQQDISANSAFGTTWMSSDPNIVTVDQNGNATSTGNGSGPVTITATSCDGVTMGTAILTVGAPAVTLVITPLTPTIAAGTTVQLAAAHSDNSPLTGTITWQSATVGVATIDAGTGLALGVSGGGSLITATESGTNITGSTTLNVSAAAARFAYVGNLDSATISSYTVSGGALAANNGATGQNPYPFVTTNPGPQQMLVHPSGHFGYYIDANCTVVTVFIDPGTGVLRLPVPEQATITQSGNCVGAIDPLGRYLYMLNEGDQTAAPPIPPKIYGFSIKQSTALTNASGDQTQGTLTLIGTGPLVDASLNFPTWIMIDRTGNFVYVANFANDGTTQSQGTINQYSIDASGVLHALTPASVNAGNGTTNGPFFGSIDRHNNLFVANLGVTPTTDPETVSAFSIGAGGQLTLLGDTPISGAAQTFNVISSPVADNLYVLDGGTGTNGQVFAYSYSVSGSPAAITLTPIGTTTQPTGPSPDGMAIDPTGTLLLVDEFGVNNPPSSSNGSVFVYTVGSNGGLPNAPATVPAGLGAEFVTFYNALATQ